MRLPLKTLIVEDDERQAGVLVKRIQENYCDIISIDSKDIAYTFEEAKSLLQNNEYNLSILDIMLQEKKCFDLFKSIPIAHLGMVAYITGYNNHTNEELAIISPHFFINKPTNNIDIGDFIYQLRVHISKLKNVQGLPEHYLFKDGNNNNVPLHNDHIYYIKSNDVYSIIYFIRNNTPGKIQVRGTLKDLHTMLPLNIYWRIEKRFIVNSQKVSSYGKASDGYGEVIFFDNIAFDVVPTDRIQYSKEYLKEYIVNI